MEDGGRTKVDGGGAKDKPNNPTLDVWEQKQEWQAEVTSATTSIAKTTTTTTASPCREGCHGYRGVGSEPAADNGWDCKSIDFEFQSFTKMH